MLMLGRKLTGQTDRWRGDIVLRSATDNHTKIKHYWVEPAPPDTATPDPPQPPPELW